jgi:hypothetical protein
MIILRPSGKRIESDRLELPLRLRRGAGGEEKEK